MQEYSTFDSVLGKIHLELCKYHEIGRFLDENDLNGEVDMDAAFFHLKHSANLGEIESLVNISKIYMQLPHDILPEYNVEVNKFSIFGNIDSYFRLFKRYINRKRMKILKLDSNI